jgi:hypothetical protein
MKAMNDERKGLQDRRQHRQQEPLADAFDREHALKLRHRIDGIDVIDALDAIQIALVDGIQAQVARFALGFGLAPNGDGRARRARLVESAPLPLIAFGLAQIVEVRDRNVGQRRIAEIPVDPAHAFA